LSEQLKHAFDQIQAEESLKQHTLDYLSRKTNGYHRSPFFVRPALIAVALSFLLLLGIAGHTLYFTPSTIISVDVNPSIELEINRFGKVIDVNSFNDDGSTIVSSVHLLFLNYETAVATLLRDESMADYLTGEHLISISVFGDDESVCQTMLSQLGVCISNYDNVHCSSGNRGLAAYAHAVGLSCGKYQAYLELLALDPTITPEEVRDLTMRQICDRINALSGETIYPSHGFGNHDGTHSGSGNGNGNGDGTGSGNKHHSETHP